MAILTSRCYESKKQIQKAQNISDNSQTITYQNFPRQWRVDTEIEANELINENDDSQLSSRGGITTGYDISQSFRSVTYPLIWLQ